jgi:trimethylamine:corrinoid methyltransferase-like protein
MSDSTDQAAASGNAERSASHANNGLSSAALFGLVWGALSDLLGTAAAATLLRRAARRAGSHDPELAKISIVRENLEYRYTLPPAWNDWTKPLSSEKHHDAQAALRHLVAELVPLLVELTGPIVVRHLAQIPELRERGIISSQEDGP